MVGEIEAVVVALNRAHVRYLVVGGVAVVLHGYLRTTGDLDLVLQLEPGNLQRAMAALKQLAYRPHAPVEVEAFADPVQRESWLRDKGLTVFSLWSPTHPVLEVDLLVREPFDFDLVYRRAVRVDLETTTATVISVEDLKTMKGRVGRPRDLEDGAALEALARGTGEGGAEDDDG